MGLLKRQDSRGGVVRALMSRHNLSRRQAYRYVLEAEAMKQPMALPDEKIVFTVKLSRSLAARVRRLAHRSGATISLVVTQALENFLRKGKDHG